MNLLQKTPKKLIPLNHDQVPAALTEVLVRMTDLENKIDFLVKKERKNKQLQKQKEGDSHE